MGYAIILAVGGLWLVGRISRGSASHPLNISRSLVGSGSALTQPVQSALTDSLSVAHETSDDAGTSLVAGEVDDVPPALNPSAALSSKPSPALTPIAGVCCPDGPAHTPAAISGARAGRAGFTPITRRVPFSLRGFFGPRRIQ